MHLGHVWRGLGIEADLQYPGARTKYGSRERFLIKQLTPAPKS